MNKEVIYIEPEDDITDIISKIEKTTEKIVALVPPKKAAVFRSAVNIKLISKSATGAEKTVVLVTTDPSIIKLAAATRLPITKDLQTPPVIPKLEDATVETTSEEIITDETSEDVKPSDENKPEENPENTEENKEKDKDKKKSNKFVEWIKAHKKLTIFGSIAIVLLIVFLVWAFVIAPRATVTVSIQTSSGNFSENVSFTKTLSEEKASEGKFYLEEKKTESVAKVEFEATGSVNVGELASGEVVVYHYFPITGDGGSVPVNSGSTFTVNNLTYIAENSVTLSWDGDLTTADKHCANYNEPSFKGSGCQITGRIKVFSSEPGTKYNISATQSGWTASANVGVYSDSAISGGTDDMITVVQESDVLKAKEQLSTASSDSLKSKLLETINDSSLVITSSYNQSTGDSVSSPAVGDKVDSGTKPTLTATTTASVFVIDKTKIEEFIKAKANLGENQKIYKMNDPFIENFSETSSGYTGKLKTSYQSGPSITENEVVEKIKGKGFGDAQHELKNINGIASVNIQGSYPWVTSIPNDTNKVTVNLEVKE